MEGCFPCGLPNNLSDLQHYYVHKLPILHLPLWVADTYYSKFNDLSKGTVNNYITIALHLRYGNMLIIPTNKLNLGKK